MSEQPQALLPNSHLKVVFPSAKQLVFFLLCDLRCDHHDIVIQSYRQTNINWLKRKVKGSLHREGCFTEGVSAGTSILNKEQLFSPFLEQIK